MPTFDDLLIADYVTPRPRSTAPRHRKEGPAHIGPRRASRRSHLRDAWQVALNVPTSTPAGGIAFKRIWRNA